MPNRLAKENSPYLLQHANNPVDWYPWSEDALKKSRQEEKPIFLSIGYAACHWCHVMAHESFEDLQTAAFMNDNFVNIKVDREERPDLDSIFMDAVVAMTGSGGWPLSIFLTPESYPFFGGTYFPPARRYNLPSFREILETIARLWQEDRPRLIQSGKDIITHLQNRQPEIVADRPLDNKILETAIKNLAQSYDWNGGGWGNPPKFPQPMVIEFLLRCAAFGDRDALDMAKHVLTMMAKGGLYDIVGGGFARYSTDDHWLIPHFEKMLYDNAQLSRVYMVAYLLTEKDSYRQVCEETLDFIMNEMMEDPTNRSDLYGGIFSSLDADSEGKEGIYYLWTSDEIRAVLTKEQGKAQVQVQPDWEDLFIAAYGITETGNFQGRNILRRSLDDKTLAQQFCIDEESVPNILNNLNSLLLHARKARIKPFIDDKVIASWNSLALQTFSEAARYLKRQDYLEIARQIADFILAELYPHDRLLRSWRKGKAGLNAYLEDYAGLILALISLYQSDPDPYWFNSAIQLTEDMISHYSDPQGGFFDTRDDQEKLWLRPKNLQDNATPSGNALAAMALLQLSAYTANGAWCDRAEAMLRSIQIEASQNPTLFGEWLCAIDFSIHPIREIAILGPQDHPTMHQFIEFLWTVYRPDCVVAISPFPTPPNSPPLLQDRPLLNDQPTAYICQNFLCKKPVNTLADFLALLSEIGN
jgi:uncharacterized protein YyaL (SSP411 family)